MLFHEIYGSYYQAVSVILKKALQQSLTKRDLSALVQEHAFGESFMTIPDGLQGGKWRLLRKDLSTPLQKEPAMPLTELEKRWMKSLLLDPRIQLFEPDGSGLEDVEPLFTPEMIVCYDRYTDGDDYTDPDYIARFRTILRAIREKRNLYISYGTPNQNRVRLVVTPYYLEYSEKDDRFRLIASGWKRSWIFNLSRVAECVFADSDRRMPLRETEKSRVTFELENRRNALQRVLLHFSHLEKETKKIGPHRYLVTLIYDRQDETEMLIRILSFGPVIRVTSPEHFIGLIHARIEKQKQLATFSPGSEA